MLAPGDSDIYFPQKVLQRKGRCSCEVPSEVPHGTDTASPASTLVTRFKVMSGDADPQAVWKEERDVMPSLPAVQKLCLFSETNIQFWERVPGCQSWESVIPAS